MRDTLKIIDSFKLEVMENIEKTLSEEFGKIGQRLIETKQLSLYTIGSKIYDLDKKLSEEFQFDKQLETIRAMKRDTNSLLKDCLRKLDTAQVKTSDHV